MHIISVKADSWSCIQRAVAHKLIISHTLTPRKGKPLSSNLRRWERSKWDVAVPTKFSIKMKIIDTLWMISVWWRISATNRLKFKKPRWCSRRILYKILAAASEDSFWISMMESLLKIKGWFLHSLSCDWRPSKTETEEVRGTCDVEEILFLLR